MQKIDIDKQIIIFLSAAAILIGELFIVFPWEMKTISNLTKKTAKIADQVNSVEREWPKKDKYLENKELLKKEVEKEKSRFLLPGQGSKALSFISANSKNFGIEIQALSPGELQDYISTKLGTFKYLPIKVKAKGKFHSLAKFLDYLGNSQYFFGVKEMSISYRAPYNIIKMVVYGIVEEK